MITKLMAERVAQERTSLEQRSTALTALESALTAENPDYEAVQTQLAAAGFDPVETLGGFVYNGLLWQPEIVDEDETFDTGLARIQAAGFQRFPRPAEACGLYIDLADVPIEQDSPQHILLQNMMEGGSEWLSLALERKGGLLHAYVDPENLVWQQHHYAWDGEAVYNQEESPEPFDIGDTSVMPRVAEELIFGRDLEELPFSLRPQIVHPPLENQLMPLIRHSHGILATYSFCSHSRGVYDLSKHEGEK